MGPPVPPDAPPVWAGLQLPAWVGSDWALVGLGLALMLVVLFAASALFGVVATIAAGGSLAAAPCGAAVGSHLAFSAFGARTAAVCGGEHGAALAIGFLPLPWALVGGLSVEAGLRFAWRRLPDDRTRRVAFGAKLALAAGLALGIIAGFVGHGDTTPAATTFRSSLNGGEVWFYGTVGTWFWAWLALRRQRVRVLPPTLPLPGLGRIGALRRVAGEGAAAFLGVALLLGVVGLVFGLVVADGGAERIGLAFGIPVVGLSFGAALADGAMGAALGGVTGHSSLLHFGLPAGEGAGAAPIWLFVVVALAPAAVAVNVWRRLERERPAEEQGALAVGAVAGVGFATAAWLAALVGRIVVLASVNQPEGGWFNYAPQTGARFRPFGSGRVSTLVIARPDPAAVLGLALVWGLAGGLGAAFLWASRHHARWTIAAAPASAPPGTGAPAGAGERPPEEPGESAWLLPESPLTAGPEPPPAPAEGSEGREPQDGTGPPLEEPPEAGKP